MLTKVKMVVTSRLNKAIQKIVEKKYNKEYIDCKYIYIETDNDGKIYLSFGKDTDIFNNHKFKEVDPYAFVASNGELEWLPLPGEKALFSLPYGKEVIDYFIGYDITKGFNVYIGAKGQYLSCKPFKQHKYKSYIKTQVTLMRPVTESEITNGLPDNISVSQADTDNGSPKIGDMIAHNNDNPNDEWLVAAKYFKNNYKRRNK